MSRGTRDGISHRYVEGKLKLKGNREKSAVDQLWKRKFLGLSFLSNRQATIQLLPKTVERFKKRICAITSRTACIHGTADRGAAASWGG
ncbi:hypothetical protein [Carboxydocella sp. ULO1]|uniref:hypothetical protein n=1 Tax=Carboxydocella sp. ULO1 TaxID=1926599 RepID=UPI00190EA16A|nr:hypothetical protein [Carboxydocella sp. ULO1]